MTDACPPKPARPWYAFLVPLVIFASGLPIVYKLFGRSFLPAPDWAAQMQVAALVVGVICAYGVIWLDARVPPEVNKGKPLGRMTKVAVCLLGFFFGRMLVLVSFPFVMTLALGQPIGMVYVVQSAKGGDGKCPRHIVLEELPPVFHRLCSYPEEARANLAPGSRIFVTGTGSSFGIFPEGFHIVDAKLDAELRKAAGMDEQEAGDIDPRALGPIRLSP
ncbi:hypothetical protein [Paracoccus aminophilus]|uniref:hypothetical protein n=1 Tax=Paracoccus aminophilus TaxID=34003 RepID=UPI0011DDF446|nr:hypothetical protein [Paracoccus aminophilus]